MVSTARVKLRRDVARQLADRLCREGAGVRELLIAQAACNVMLSTGLTYDDARFVVNRDLQRARMEVAYD